MANSYALDLYGEVEDLLKLDSSTQKLHSIYLKKLNKVKFNSLLDIGSGNGNFLLKVKKRYKNIDIMGIEKSPYMRKISLKKGVSVYSSLDEIDREFDIAVAIFDMVNYLSFKELKEFFEKLYLKLNKNGLFFFDITSFLGFRNIAVGNYIAKDKDRFLTIESFFSNRVYKSYFTLFKRDKEDRYIKKEASIYQYYYPLSFFHSLDNWHLISYEKIYLYSNHFFDKYLILLKKV